MLLTIRHYIANQLTLYKLLVVGLVALGVMHATQLVMHRIAYDQSKTSVQIVAPWSVIKAHFQATGASSQSQLKQLVAWRQAGLTSIMIEEDSLTQLVSDAKITLLQGADILNMLRVGSVYQYVLKTIVRKNNIKPGAYYLFVDETELYNRLKQYLTAALGTESVRALGFDTLEVQTDLDQLLAVRFGINQDDATYLTKQAYTVIPALTTHPTHSSDSLKLKVASVLSIPNQIIVMSDQITPRHRSWVAGQLLQESRLVGSYEFDEPRDIPDFLDAAVPIVRIHRIESDDLSRLNPVTMQKRYSRAVRERGVSVLRLETIDNTSTAFIQSLSTALTQSGYTITGTHTPAIAPKPATLLQTATMSAAIIIGLLLLIKRFVPRLPDLSSLIIGLVTMASGLYTSYYFGNLSIWQQCMAIIAAIVCPTYALVRFFNPTATTIKLRILQSLQFIFHCTLVIIMGAILIQGLLYNTGYLLNITPFYGVKIAIIIPILLVSLYFYIQPHRLAAIAYVLKRVFLQPVNMIILGNTVFIISFIGLYLLRSGNYVSWQIPGIETSIRLLLEDWLFIRPRTKEFLVGYPFLLLAYCGADNWISKRWLWLYMAIGCVALISMINSFCHLHTPFFVSVYRSGLGISLGVMIGIIIVAGVIIGRSIWRRI